MCRLKREPSQTTQKLGQRNYPRIYLSEDVLARAIVAIGFRVIRVFFHCGSITGLNLNSVYSTRWINELAIRIIRNLLARSCYCVSHATAPVTTSSFWTYLFKLVSRHLDNGISQFCGSSGAYRSSHVFGGLKVMVHHVEVVSSFKYQMFPLSTLSNRI